MHPDMNILIEARTPPPPGQTIEENRAAWTVYSQKLSQPVPDNMTTFDRMVPTEARDVPVRVYHPATGRAPRPCILYMHGGGFMKGDLDSSDSIAWGFAEKTGASVISVDYALSPEHPYPAAFNDCYGVLSWLADQGGDIDVDGAQIAVAGDSAGGNLAAVSALMANARGGPELAFQLLIYPVLDSALDRPSAREHADGPMLTAERMAHFWQAYVPNPVDRQDWRCAPLRAPDLSGLPPTMILAAPIDPLYSEGEAYAARLAEAGVAVEHVPMPGMCHAIFQAPALLDESRRGIDRAGAALKSAFWP